MAEPRVAVLLAQAHHVGDRLGCRRPRRRRDPRDSGSPPGWTVQSPALRLHGRSWRTPPRSAPWRPSWPRRHAAPACRSGSSIDLSPSVPDGAVRAPGRRVGLVGGRGRPRRRPCRGERRRAGRSRRGARGRGGRPARPGRRRTPRRAQHLGRQRRLPLAEPAPLGHRRASRSSTSSSEGSRRPTWSS